MTTAATAISIGPFLGGWAGADGRDPIDALGGAETGGMIGGCGGDAGVGTGPGVFGIGVSI